MLGLIFELKRIVLFITNPVGNKRIFSGTSWATLIDKLCTKRKQSRAHRIAHRSWFVIRPWSRSTLIKNRYYFRVTFGACCTFRIRTLGARYDVSLQQYVFNRILFSRAIYMCAGYEARTVERHARARKPGSGTFLSFLTANKILNRRRCFTL